MLRIQQGEPFSSATVRSVEQLEEGDSDHELFTRRMGFRNYFKELKMHLSKTNQLPKKGKKYLVKKEGQLASGKKVVKGAKKPAKREGSTKRAPK